MMVLKKKEIIAAALVVLIGVAGYLNWSYQDTVKVTDGESYTQQGKKLGEAQYVNATAEGEEDKTAGENTQGQDVASPAPSGNVNYFEQAKAEKETSRSKSMEILKETAANESFDKEIRDKAQNQILEIAKDVEKETAVENLAKAKGYSEISVFIDSDMVNIVVKKENLSETDIAKIQEIAIGQLSVAAKNIKIVEVK
jgi:stage III sporulation protein AH